MNEHDSISAYPLSWLTLLALATVNDVAGNLLVQVSVCLCFAFFDVLL